MIDYIIDTHAHLHLCKRDIDELIENAFSRGIKYIINVATSIDTAKTSLELAKKYKFIIPTIGIHPCEHTDIDRLDLLEKMLELNNFVAVGEIGLDYYRNYCDSNIQKGLFYKQLEIAKKHNKPVIIHNRQADNDILDILNNFKALPKIFHCYSTDTNFAKSVINDNAFFSFTATITYSKKEAVINAIKYLPLERIMLETDCPYLSPNFIKNEENQPANTYFVANKIAEIKNISLEDVISQTSKNATLFFDLL
jgi:TatD DNase family protein